MQQLTSQIRTKFALRLPGLLSEPVRFVPQTLQKYLVTQVLQGIFQELIETGDLDFLNGKYLKFEIPDCNLQWTYTLDYRFLYAVDNKHADASIRCNLREFVLLANQRVDPDTLFFQRRLVIEGDTELGLTMKNLMDTLDPKNLPLPLLKGLQLLEYFLDPK